MIRKIASACWSKFQAGGTRFPKIPAMLESLPIQSYRVCLVSLQYEFPCTSADLHLKPDSCKVVPLQVNAVRRQLGIRVSGFDPPAPVSTFEECGLDKAMMLAIKAAKSELLILYSERRDCYWEVHLRAILFFLQSPCPS